MSAGNIDQILHIMSDIVGAHGGQPPFVNHRDVYQAIDAIPIGSVPWQSFTFTYEGPKPTTDVPKWMDAEYVIWFRDPRQLFLKMLKNRDFGKSFNYAPYREFDGQGRRQYEHFMSGDWAWKQAVRIKDFYYFMIVIVSCVGYSRRNARKQRSYVRPYHPRK